MKVKAPEKELRFTRSRQAIPFYLGGAILLGLATTILVTSYYRDINPELPHPLWALGLVTVAALMLLVAQRMTQHAYLILSPVGLEIFPLYRPVKTMSIVYWQEIHLAEMDDAQKWLTLHTSKELSSGVSLSLAPIRKDIRPLLAQAVMGRVNR